MQRADELINRIPDWLMGMIYAGLIYAALYLIIYSLIIAFPESGKLDLGILLLKLGFSIWVLFLRFVGFGFETSFWRILDTYSSTYFNIYSFVLWSMPYVLLGGLFGLIKSIKSKIVRTIILAFTLSFVMIVVGLYIGYMLIMYLMFLNG